MTSASIYFMNSKDTVDLCKVNFCIRELFVHCNTGSCFAHIIGGVSIYLYVYVGPFVFSVCLSVSVVLNQSNGKNHVICVKTAENSMHCYTKHTARCC